MVKSEILPRIAATLKHGEFSGEKRKQIMIIYSLFTALMLLGMSAFVVYFSVEFVNRGFSTETFILAFIGVIFLFSLLIAVISYLVLRNERIRKEILLWLDDAVEARGFAKKVGESVTDALVDSITGRGHATKIEISFKIDGNRYKRESVAKQFETTKGYRQIWNKYADREVAILYSPKYDQVIILKDN